MEWLERPVKNRAFKKRMKPPMGILQMICPGCGQFDGIPQIGTFGDSIQFLPPECNFDVRTDLNDSLCDDCSFELNRGGVWVRESLELTKEERAERGLKTSWSGRSLVLKHGAAHALLDKGSYSMSLHSGGTIACSVDNFNTLIKAIERNKEIQAEFK